MIDPDKIITEGKYDPDLYEDPAMVYVDIINEEHKEAEDDLMLGDSSDASLIDIVMRDEPVTDDLDEEHAKVLAQSTTSDR